jgi:hypothetical protein
MNKKDAQNIKLSISSDTPGQSSQAEREPLPKYLDETQLETSEIIKIVHDIRRFSMSSEDRKNIFENKYPAFVEKYPKLFEMVCSNAFELDKFIYMMKLREQIEKKERTVESTSAEVGQRFFDMYVDKEKLNKAD